jgi:hypothetical protein
MFPESIGCIPYNEILYHLNLCERLLFENFVPDRRLSDDINFSESSQLTSTGLAMESNLYQGKSFIHFMMILLWKMVGNDHKLVLFFKNRLDEEGYARQSTCKRSY